MSVQDTLISKFCNYPPHIEMILTDITNDEFYNDIEKDMEGYYEFGNPFILDHRMQGR